MKQVIKLNNISSVPKFIDSREPLSNIVFILERLLYKLCDTIIIMLSIKEFLIILQKNLVILTQNY